METRIMEEVLKKVHENKKCSLAMVTEVQGSSPGKINAMMAVFVVLHILCRLLL